MNAGKRPKSVMFAGEWSVFTPHEVSVPGRDFKALNRMAIMHGSGVLQCAALCCIVLQCVAVCCIVL